MSASREILNYRRDALKAFKRVGSKFLVRSAYTLWDLEKGLTSRCPKCYHPGYSNATDPRCPICFGTGFDQGYAPAELRWGSIDYATSLDLDDSQRGFVDAFSSTFKIMSPPLVYDGDVLAPILSDNPLTIGTPMEIDDAVAQKVLVGWVSNNRSGSVNPEDNIVGQTGKLKSFVISDIRLESSFWEFEDQYPEVVRERTERALDQ